MLLRAMMPRQRMLLCHAMPLIRYVAATCWHCYVDAYARARAAAIAAARDMSRLLFLSSFRYFALHMPP